MAGQATRLVVEIDGSGAKVGAQVVNDALKSIENSVIAADNARRAFQTNLSKLGGAGLGASVTKINNAFKSIQDQVIHTKAAVTSLATPFAQLAKAASTSAYEVKLAMRAMANYISLPGTAIKELGWMFRDLGVYAHSSAAIVKTAMRSMSSYISAPEAAIKELGWMFRDLGVHAHSSAALVKTAMRGMSSAIMHPEAALKELGWMFMDLGAHARAGVSMVKSVMSDLSMLITTPKTSLTALATAFSKIGDQRFNALVEAFQAIDSAIKHTKGRVGKLKTKFADVEESAKTHMLEAGRAVIKLGNAFTGAPLQAITLFSNKMLEVGIDATIGMKAATDAVVKLSAAMIPLIRKVANIASKFSLLGKSLEDGLAPALQKLLQFGTAFNHPKEQVLAFKRALEEVGIGAGSGIKTIIAVLRDLADGFSSSILAAKRLRAGLGRIGTAALAGTDKAIVALYDLGKQARNSAESVKILSKILRNLGTTALHGTDKAIVSLYDLGKQARNSAESVKVLSKILRNLGATALHGTDKAIVSMYDLSKQARSSAANVLLLSRALRNLGFSAESGIKAANAAIKSLKTAFTAPKTAITTLNRSLGTIGTKAAAAAKRVDTAMASMVKSLERPTIYIKVLANAMRNIGTQAAAAAAKVKVAMRTIAADLKAPGQAAKDFAAALKTITGLAFTRFNTSITTLAANTRSLVTAIDALVKAVDKLYASLIKVTAAAELAAKAFDKLATAAGNATRNMGNTAGAATRSTKAFDALKNAASRMGAAVKTALSPFNLLRKALSGIWTLLKSTAKAIVYLGKVSVTAAGKVLRLAGAIANIATLGMAGRLGRLALKIVTLGRAGRTAANDIGVLTKAWRLFRNVYMARMAGGGMAGVQKSLVDARIEWDKMRSTFVAVTGSAKSSREELLWLRKTADDLGSSFTHASFPFAKLAAAAKGTALEGAAVRKIFEDISVATTTLHMSGDDLKFTFYALQQMVSKGSVTMEELRRQLGERIPGAFQDAAKAYAKMKGDMTLGTDDLEKAIKKGLVDPIEFLPILAAQIAERFKEGLLIARIALQAEINRMQTMWFFFKKEVSEGPLDAAWITFTQTLTKAIERMMPHAKSIGEFLAKIVNWAGEWVEILTAHPNAVSDFLNLDGWSRLYDYIDRVATSFLNANFPGMSTTLNGFGSAFGFLADTIWLLPDAIISAGKVIELEIEHWPDVWDSFKNLVVATIAVLRIEVEYQFTILMINIKAIVVTGFNDIMAYIGAQAKVLKNSASLTMEDTREGVMGALEKSLKRGGMLTLPGNLMKELAPIGFKAAFKKNVTVPLMEGLGDVKLENVNVSKEMEKAETSFASKRMAAQDEWNSSLKATGELQEVLYNEELDNITKLATEKRRAAIAAREAGKAKYAETQKEYKTALEAAEARGEKLDAAKVPIVEQIKKTEKPKPSRVGGGSGSGAKGKTPTQVLAEENRLRTEKYALTKAYYELMEASTPGVYEDALRQLEADKARTDAQLQMNEALQKGIITEEQHRMAIAATEEQYKKTMDAQSKYVQVIKDDFASIFGSLADMAKEFAGEQSETYRVLFAMSKAFAIADATMKMASAIMEAWNTPWPLNLGAVAQVTTATAALLSSIASVTYSGGYDKGGAIPAGSYGMVGEYGPEFVKGPAQVTGREDTAKMIANLVDEIRSGKISGGGSNVRIINVQDESAEDYLGSDPGERKVMNILRRNRSAVRGMVA